MIVIDFEFSDNCTKEDKKEIQDLFIRLLSIDRNSYFVGLNLVLPSNINKKAKIKSITVREATNGKS